MEGTTPVNTFTGGRGRGGGRGRYSNRTGRGSAGGRGPAVDLGGAEEEPVAPPSMFAAEPRTANTNPPATNNPAPGRGGRGRGGGRKSEREKERVSSTAPSLAEIAGNPPKPPTKEQEASTSGKTRTNPVGKQPSSSSSSSSSAAASARIKLTLRKLPPTRDYTTNDLERDLHAVVDRLLAPTPQSASAQPSAEQRAKEIAAQVEIEHVVEGKISRKRGPVYGAAFVSISSSLFQAFVTRCPQEIPLLPDTDAGAQPEISLALYAKPFRPREKEKSDPLSDTYLEDPEFLAFKERIEKPVQKLSSADIQMDLKKTQAQQTAVSLEERLKNNSLLQYMREKAQKKVLSRSVLSLTQSASGKSLSAREIQRAERKEKKREKRRKKEKELGVDEDADKEKKKKKNRERRERKKKELSAVSDVGAPMLGSQSQKLLVLKREKPSETGGESLSTKSEKAPKPRKERPSRREKKKERDAENSNAAGALPPPPPMVRVLLKRDPPLPAQT